MTNGKRESRFQHAVTTFPVQFARGAEFRFLRIDVAAGEVGDALHLTACPAAVVA